MTDLKEINMNEVDLSEMQQANGGILPIVLGVGTLMIGGILIAFMPDKKK